MKYRSLKLTCLALLACCSGLSAADYASSVLSLNPQVYWRLSETTQPPAADVAANLGSLGAAATGYYQGAGTQHPVEGALIGSTDLGAYFLADANTTGNAMLVPYLPEMNPNGSFTAEAWLSPASVNAAGTLTCALSCGNFGDPRSGWLIYMSDTGWNFRMYNEKGLATSASISGGPAPEAYVWYHVVAVYDATANTATLYVNGEQKAQATPTGYVAGRTGSLYVGARADGSFWWNGLADEVAFYGKALSATDVSAHYQNGTSATPSPSYDQLVLANGPLAYYRLNDPTYDPPTNLPAAANAGSLGAAMNGSFNPGIKAGEAGPRPQQFQGFEAGNNAGGLNGVVGHVSTPYQLNNMAQFSIVGWVKRGAIHSGRGGYFGQNDLLEFGDADNGANIEMWSAAKGQIKISYPFADDTWGQLALVDDGTKIVLYANGLEVGRTVGTNGNGSTLYYFNIGGGGVFNATGDVFKGAIDEVAVFNKALTQEQIRSLYFASGSAPIIITQPEAPARTLYQGNTLVLTVTADGPPPLQYEWRKNGSPINGQTTATLTVTDLPTGDATYDVVVSNSSGSVTSSPVSVTVLPAETVKPTLEYATGTPSFTKVRLWFSEPLDPATAQTAGNYVIPGLQVLSATLASPAGTDGDNMVDLVTSQQTPATMYSVTVSNVRDQSNPANTIAPATLQFSSLSPYAGHVDFEHYDNIAGAADSDLQRGLSDPRVIAKTPTTFGYISGTFNTRSVFPDDSHENYLARMTGWIVPKDTASYHFFVRSDDASRVYLSANADLPDTATATPICIETDCCDGFYEPGADPATTTTAIPLVGGQRYGIVVLLKEGGGGDWLELAWRKSTDSTPAANLTPMSAEFFTTYVDPNVELTFVKQPTDEQAMQPEPQVEFANVNFATGNGGFTVTNSATPATGPWTYDAGAGQWSANGTGTGPFQSSLYSPEFTVPQSNMVSLSFSHRYSLESPLWDSGQVLISVNGGTFTPVSPDNFTANGYAEGAIVGTGPVLGQRGFNGVSAGNDAGTLITSTVILGTFNANDKIRVQFLGAWDDSTVNGPPNWVIKTLKLTYGLVPIVTFEAEGSATLQGEPAPFSYQWQRDDGTGFVNISNATASNYRLIVKGAADFAADYRVLLVTPAKTLASDVVQLNDASVTPPNIAIATEGGVTRITYEGTLRSSATVEGNYTPVDGATSPYTVPQGTQVRFYRSVK